MAEKRIVVSTIEFYSDEPELMQESVVGVVENGLFTGHIEHGGKYQDDYFYVNGLLLGDEYDGYDEKEAAVKKALGDFEEPIRPDKFEYFYDVSDCVNADGYPARHSFDDNGKNLSWINSEEARAARISMLTAI